jgi:hypothetical protein
MCSDGTIPTICRQCDVRCGILTSIPVRISAV